MVELLAVFVSVPVPGLPFVLHLLDFRVGLVAFLSCSVNVNTGKKCLATTVMFCALLEDKMALLREILEGSTGKLKTSHNHNKKCWSRFWIYYQFPTVPALLDSWSVHDNYLDLRQFKQSGKY